MSVKGSTKRRRALPASGRMDTFPKSGSVLTVERLDARTARLRHMSGWSVYVAAHAIESVAQVNGWKLVKEVG